MPRVETEILGHTALDLVRATDASLVVDLCTGAGNLAAAVAVAAPQVTLHAADLSTSRRRAGPGQHGLRRRRRPRDPVRR